MQIFGLQNNSAYVASSSQQASQSTSSFASYFSTTKDSSDDPVQEFMNYAKETPAQRMFYSWLGSQHISEAQFNAMSPEEKQKLIDKFEEQLKQKLRSDLTGSSNSTTASSSVSA